MNINECRRRLLPGGEWAVWPTPVRVSDSEAAATTTLAPLKGVALLGLSSRSSRLSREGPSRNKRWNELISE